MNNPRHIRRMSTLVFLHTLKMTSTVLNTLQFDGISNSPHSCSLKSPHIHTHEHTHFIRHTSRGLFIVLSAIRCRTLLLHCTRSEEYLFNVVSSLANGKYIWIDERRRKYPYLTVNGCCMVVSCSPPAAYLWGLRFSRGLKNSHTHTSASISGGQSWLDCCAIRWHPSTSHTMAQYRTQSSICRMEMC